MRILDRYILKSFVFNYLLALGVLLGMFTVLDLIVNFDSFTKPPPSSRPPRPLPTGHESSIALTFTPSPTSSITTATRCW